MSSATRPNWVTRDDDHLFIHAHQHHHTWCHNRDHDNHDHHGHHHRNLHDHDHHWNLHDDIICVWLVHDLEVLHRGLMMQPISKLTFNFQKKNKQDRVEFYVAMKSIYNLWYIQWNVKKDVLIKFSLYNHTWVTHPWKLILCLCNCLCICLCICLFHVSSSFSVLNFLCIVFVYFVSSFKFPLENWTWVTRPWKLST